jgi:hypothetical protein
MGTPSVGSDDIFRGTLSADCVVNSATHGGVDNLATYLLNQAQKETVNSGPTAETYQGLPSVLLDVTDKDAGNQTEIRSNVHIAHDSSGHLEFADVSTSVQGQGDSQYLKGVGVTASVKELSEGSFGVTVTTELDVKRPWYAPGGIFQSEVEKNSQEQFQKRLGNMLPEYAGQL